MGNVELDQLVQSLLHVDLKSQHGHQRKTLARRYFSEACAFERNGQLNKGTRRLPVDCV